MSIPAAQHEVEAEVTQDYGLDLMPAEMRTDHTGIRNAITETPGVRMGVQQQNPHVRQSLGALRSPRALIKSCSAAERLD